MQSILAMGVEIDTGEGRPYRIQSSIKYSFITIIYILLGFALPVFANSPKILFDHYTSDEGLSHNSVYAIIEDSQGFMWFGTRFGLNRFDGCECHETHRNNFDLLHAGQSTAYPDGSPCHGTGLDGVDMGSGNMYVTITDEPLPPLQPQSFGLDQNYPNPFNPSTSIFFEIPQDGHVKLVIYDLVGREVATLVNEQRLGGWHSMRWIAHDNAGTPLSAGIYLYELSFFSPRGEAFRDVKKFTLLK